MNKIHFQGMRGILVLMITLVSLTASGQAEESGKYSRTDYPPGYLILNSDKSFKFRFGFDIQWDLACGQYDVKGDTLRFSYTSDMFNNNCNNERINVTDISDYFLKQRVDKRWRPITARFVRNKIQVIKTGDVHEPETIIVTSHYYRKEKQPKKKGQRH